MGVAIDVDVVVLDWWLAEDFRIEWLCILGRGRGAGVAIEWFGIRDW